MIRNIKRTAKDDFEPLVVAMRSDAELKYAEPVKFEIRQKVKNDYICAADYINFSHVDVVSVQHEFGLFGGDGGSYLNLLLKRLSAPIITTLHTVLDDPDESYLKSLVDVCNASYKVITMNERGVTMLEDIYRVKRKKIQLVPHGIPDLPFVDNNYYKHKFGMEGRRTILTFGLLSKNKGIEVMLKAMPAIIEAEPSVLYVILGMTHPSVLKNDGESYRFMLQQMVKELGLQNHVIFHNRFVSDEELSNFLCAADFYVTPYLKREQLTSGTLSFAVGTGKAVVSTPYWAAMELLAKGQGKLVRFGDSKHTAKVIVDILQDDSLFYSLRRKAYEYGRSRTWPKVGQTYWKLFSAKRMPVHVQAKASPLAAKAISSIEVPEPTLVHLKRLTDDTGLIQHAKVTIPNREHGYATDDNARGVIAMTKYYAQYHEPDALGLFNTYMSFILHSQKKDGKVRNIMNFDRSWQKSEPVHDALGRVLWALGTVMAQPPSSSYLPVIKDRFDLLVKYVNKQYPRGMAYSILGMSDYLKQFPGASDIKRQLEITADGLVHQHEEHNFPDWQWFEDELTYDNAIIPCALFAAGSVLGDKYTEVAEKTCEFLLEKTFDGEHFSFVGCKGWYERKGSKATFDQQPIEVLSTIMMLRSAYEATGKSEYLKLQRKAFDWFLGENDLHIPLYDFRTKGCNDALTPGGVNINQGAESILSFLLSLLAIVESYSAAEDVAEEKQIPAREDILQKIAEASKKAGKPASIIKSISNKTKSKKNEVEELA